MSDIERPSPSAIIPQDEIDGRVLKLGQRAVALDVEIRTALAAFRAGLVEYAGNWSRDVARRVAVTQNSVTLKLGRPRIAHLKGEIDAHVGSLPDVVEKEFTFDRHARSIDGSSGQVAAVVTRSFDAGVRRVLATVFPIMLDSGYVRDEHFLEEEADYSRPPRIPPLYELPGELEELLQKIGDLITDRKVLEAKMTCFEKQRSKEQAAELWENA